MFQIENIFPNGIDAVYLCIIHISLCSVHRIVASTSIYGIFYYIILSLFFCSPSAHTHTHNVCYFQIHPRLDEPQRVFSSFGKFACLRLIGQWKLKCVEKSNVMEWTTRPNQNHNRTQCAREILQFYIYDGTKRTMHKQNVFVIRLFVVCVCFFWI